MEPDAREAAHDAVNAPCDNRTFLRAYLARATDNLVIG